MYQKGISKSLLILSEHIHPRTYSLELSLELEQNHDSDNTD